MGVAQKQPCSRLHCVAGASPARLISPPASDAPLHHEDSGRAAGTPAPVLQSVTAALSETNTAEQVARVVADRILPVVGADAASVALLHEEEGVLEVVRAAADAGVPCLKYRIQPLGVLRTGRVPGRGGALDEVITGGQRLPRVDQLPRLRGEQNRKSDPFGHAALL